ncbi:MAG: ATP-binding protein [Bdellovibrionota bacterium]
MKANKLKIKFGFPWRIFARTIAIQTIVVILAVGCTGLAARYFLKKQFLEQASTQLLDSLIILEKELSSDNNPIHLPDFNQWCHKRSKGTANRLTVIDKSGKVLCDSHHGVADMENHLSRPEVQQALANQFGTATRYSTTLNQEMHYGSILIHANGNVLRGAIPLSVLAKTLHVFDRALSIILIVIAAALSTLATLTTRRFVAPISRIMLRIQNVLEAPEISPTQAALEADENAVDELYGEWIDVEKSIEEIRKVLLSKTEYLQRERDETATLMSAISEGILAIDTEGVPLFFNSRFAVLFGQEEKLKSRTLRYTEIIRAPEVLETFATALNERTTATTKGIPLRISDGTERFFSVSVAPLFKDAGDLYGVVGVFHDVTELKAAEQIRIDFVANVSHELRTPLTAIKGYTDTLIQDFEAHKTIEKPFLDVIARNVTRLMNLIGDLLDLSSLESGESLQRSPMRTEEVTSRVVQQLKPNFDKKNQMVIVRCKAPSVHGDAKRIEQVLVNLLDNASKYTPSRGEIEILWNEMPKVVELRVKDNGPGIPPEHIPRLFERFYRVDKARSREQGGTGLGLAIVKHIMQKHDGTVAVESTVGRGSTFICKFPS